MRLATRMASRLATGFTLTALTLLVGCGGDGDVATGPDNGTGGTYPTDGGSSGDGNTPDVIELPDGSGAADGGDAAACEGVTCPQDQHCDVVAGEASCVPNNCADLGCDPYEDCVTTDGGAHCEDRSCTSDLACSESEYCDGTRCQPDICDPGDERCDGQALLACDPNGGGETVQYTCGSANPYYVSQCEASGAGAASCPCEDDWDCPQYTDCEADTCEGTAVMPTCSLDPLPFKDVLPVNEITWGGTQANPSADGSPFPASTQVVLSPIVANLDDDNGDGLIDERDFPEIIFTTFCNSNYVSNGILRAIHGGGPNKGADFWASCANNVWHEGDALNAVSCTCAQADLDSTAGLAVGDLNNDGVPEIVAITEGSDNGSSTAAVRIYDNLGNVLATSANFSQGGANPAPTIANVDNDGFAEIVVGRSLFTLGTDANGDLVFVDRFQGTQNHGQNGQGPVSCIANVVGDSRQEIIAGSTVYRLPNKPAGVTSQSDCTGTEVDPDEVDWCAGRLAVVWDGQGVNGAAALPDAAREGFCAVADVLGADQEAAPGPNNPLDGQAEIITIRSGWMYVFNGQDGTLRRSVNVNFGGGGGTPNVDDFDGDGFPEVGSAGGTAYAMIDLQPPTASCPAWPANLDDNTTFPRTPPNQSCNQHADCGDETQFGCNVSTSTCVCLHNGWKRGTEDDSSRVTGSSVFDFNGDGAAEVVYNDECFFRVYDGTNGASLFQEHSESRTRIEYPIVADVDNDGNAEIVFATTTESKFCAGDGGNQAIENEYNAGIEVWGDASDLWVSARRIWNEHAYHITNVTESGRIPMYEPESWKPLNGRFYNTYRSNPRSFGVAPDLTVQGVQISSPDAVCGQLSDKIDITVQIANIGDLRVGPGVVVSFHGTWDSVPLTEPLAGPGGLPLEIVLQNSLEPGDVVLLSVSYDAADNAPQVLPDRVRVVVDDGDLARECVESNNEMEVPVEAGSLLPDLTIELGAISLTDCPAPKIPTTIHNIGSAPASDILVRYYAGNPSAGGSLLHEVTRPGPIPPGGSDTFTATLQGFPQNLNILVYGVVDPLNTIEECNDGNNSDAADNKILCGGVR